MLCHLFLLSMRGLACDQLGINHYQAPTHKGWGLWKMHLFLATIGCRDNLPWKLVVRGMRPYRSTLINNKAFFAPLNQWLQMELVYTLDLRMSWQRNGKVKKCQIFAEKLKNWDIALPLNLPTHVLTQIIKTLPTVYTTKVNFRWSKSSG